MTRRTGSNAGLYRAYRVIRKQPIRKRSEMTMRLVAANDKKNQAGRAKIRNAVQELDKISKTCPTNDVGTN